MIFIIFLTISHLKQVSSQTALSSSSTNLPSIDYDDNPPSPSNLTTLNPNTTDSKILEFERAFQESLSFDLPGSNCTPSFINEFPPDHLTASQRQSGFILIHIFITVYVFYAFAIVCGDYFVPSVEHISQDLKIESDIAGATIMGIATSSPELFTSVVGTFIMRGDIGVGTVVGSAVFNHLAVCAFIGFGCSQAVVLDWWPVTRDIVFYAISVISLFFILLDLKIFWYESAFLLCLYFLYIFGMYHDALLHSWVETFLNWKPKINWCGHRSGKYHIEQPSAFRRKSRILGVSSEASASTATIVTISHGIAFAAPQLHPKKPQKVTQVPRTSKVLLWIEWVTAWPIKAVLSLTIPDCRMENGRRMWYGVTFIMSTLWIAMLSYIAAWMMTIVAHTFRVPDTVFGVSIIAAGTSVPEAVSSVIVAQRGFGTMAVSNAVGSNTFNILVCLGVPWLIQSMVNINVRNNYAEITSTALKYSTGLLIVSLVVMYGILVWNKYKIDKKIAWVAMILYLCFLTFDTLVEMNVLGNVNLPIC